MIISHKHRFIFIHVARTGGRSLNLSLLPHCGPDDVVTPVRCHHPGQNNSGFWQHMPAHAIRQEIGASAFDSYFKFAFERNPWDKIISRYWAYAGDDKKRLYKRLPEWLTGKPLDFKTWFELRKLQGRLFGFGHIRFPSSFQVYTRHSRLAVDLLGRYEYRNETIAEISDRLGIEISTGHKVGTDRHRNRKPCAELFNDDMQVLVEALYKKELALLGYEFGKPPPADYLTPQGRRPIGSPPQIS
ncbi:MAG: sulfotransferase family 2 domain-containing protein [Alphaproteobacteria bacterium]